MSDRNKKAIEGILHHLIEFVEKPHPLFSGFPICPFSKKARQEDKIMFSVYPFSLESNAQSASELFEVMEEFTKTDRHEVLVVIHPDPDAIAVTEMEEFIDRLNEQISPMDLVAFTGHPGDRFNIQGVYTRQAPYIHFTVQREEDVKKSSDILSKTAYYDCWTAENLKAVGLPRN